MLKIFNDLQPFIEDCSRRYAVREYARTRNVSPPTASTMLSRFHKEGLLSMHKERTYLFFWANKESPLFKGLARLYWLMKLEETQFLPFLREVFTTPTAILFGSLAKTENNADSDIDIAVISPKIKISLEKYEKRLKRKIHLLMFADSKAIPKELQENIFNGYVLCGRIKTDGLERMRREENSKGHTTR